MSDIIPFPNKKYSIIYADPPWSYKDKRTSPGPSGNKAGGAENHYPTMDIEAIKALPVADIADDPCILFMWVTWPLMPVWNDVVTSWGFQYKTLGFDWIKSYPKSNKLCIGAGAYTRSNVEPCIIAVRGRGASLIKDHSICNAQIHARAAHSSKPQVFRDLIVQLCGDIPRIELFSRNNSKGWDVWGNQVGLMDEVQGEQESTGIGCFFS